MNRDTSSKSIWYVIKNGRGQITVRETGTGKEKNLGRWDGRSEFNKMSLACEIAATRNFKNGYPQVDVTASAQLYAQQPTLDEAVKQMMQTKIDFHLGADERNRRVEKARHDSQAKRENLGHISVRPVHGSVLRHLCIGTIQHAIAQYSQAMKISQDDAKTILLENLR